MSAPGVPEEPPRLARAMWKRFLAGMTAIAFLTAAGTATAVLLEIDTSVQLLNAGGNDLPGVDEVLDDVDAGDPQTLLVLGSDRRWGDSKLGIKPRSDTIILVRLDPDKEATAILSIPRDLKVSYGERQDKINAAYSIGGAKLTVRKIKELFGGDFPINHVVNVNFMGFQRAVNALNCVYVDVDRRYFNDNAPPVGSPFKYATIDLQPGYQRLCGKDSLDYVRYRHGDTDLVRGARQQDFLSQAKAQVGVDRLFSDRKRLLKVMGDYTDIDIKSVPATLRLLKLAYESSRQPLREIRFRGELGETYVTASEKNLERMRDEFLNAELPRGPKATPKPRSRESGKRRRKGGGNVPGLVDAQRAGEDLAVPAAIKVDFPVYFPRFARAGYRYWNGFDSAAIRVYDLYAPGGRKHQAYRLTATVPGVGEYYGVQGTTWRDPPILSDPSEIRKVGGRRLELFYDGNRLKTVAWRTDKAVYWVSNTLVRSLTNRQMLGIARSLRRVGTSG